MSKRKAKIVHLLAFIALVANLFAPLVELEKVNAANNILRAQSDPTVSYDTGQPPVDEDLSEVVQDGSGSADGDGDANNGVVPDPGANSSGDDGGSTEDSGNGDTPDEGNPNPGTGDDDGTTPGDEGGVPVGGDEEAPQPTAVVPNAPSTYALECADGVGYTSAVAEPNWTEGVVYNVINNGNGTVSVTATLTDATNFAWDTNAMAAQGGQWSVGQDNVARYQLITLTPCPEPEPTEVPEDPVDDEVDPEDVDETGDAGNSDDQNSRDDADNTGDADTKDDQNNQDDDAGEAGDTEVNDDVNNEDDEVDENHDADNNDDQSKSDDDADKSDDTDKNNALNNQDDEEQSEVTVEKSDAPEGPDKNDNPDATTVAPAVPVILDVCIDGVPELDYDPTLGIDYQLQGPGEDGEFSLMAVLQDGYSWDAEVADWTVTDSVATYNDLIIDVPDCASVQAASRSMGLMNDDDTAEYGITKGRSPNAVVMGDQVTYTIRVDWGEPTNAAPFYVTDVIPSPLTYVSSDCTSSGPGIVSCAESGTAPSLRWDVNPNGAVSGFVLITIVTQLPPDVWGIQVTNSAFVNDPSLNIVASNTFTILEQAPPSIKVLPPDVLWLDSVCVGNEAQFPTFTPPVTGDGVSYTVLGKVGPGEAITILANIGDGYLWDHESDDWPAEWEFVRQPDTSTNPVTPGLATYSFTFGSMAKCEQTPTAPEPLTPSVCIAGEVSKPTVSKPENSTYIKYGDPVVSGPSNGKFTITMTATLTGDGHDGWSDTAGWPGEGTWTINGTKANYTHKVPAGECEKVDVPKPNWDIAACPSGVLESSFFKLSSYKGVEVSVEHNGTVISSGTDGWEIELNGSTNHEIKVTLTLLNNGAGWQWPSQMHGFTKDGKTATKTIKIAASDCEVSKAPTFDATSAVCDAGVITDHIFKYWGGKGIDVSYVADPAGDPVEDNGAWVFVRDGKNDFSVTITLKLKNGYYWPASILDSDDWSVDGKKAERTWTLDAASCEETTPREITLVPSVCEEGVVKAPSVLRPENGDGIEYSAVNATENGNGTWTFRITATLDSGFMWSDSADWPEGWTPDKNDSTKAHFKIKLDEAQCTVAEPLLVDPTPGVCENGTWADPVIPVGSTSVKVDGTDVVAIEYTLDGPDENGDYTITATWQHGFSQPDGLEDDGWKKVNAYKATFDGQVDMNKCDQPEFLKIEIGLSQCVQGDAQPHTLTIPTMAGMTVTSIDGDGSADMDPVAAGFGDFTFPADNFGEVVVTFTIADKYEWPSTFPDNVDGTWAKKSETKATFTFTLTANSCEEDVEISKSPASQDAGIDDTVSFDITVTNGGDGNATGVSFEDTIDPDLWAIGGWTFTPEDANCEFDGNIFSCSDIDLDADGGEFAVTITSGEIDAENIPMCGPYYNQASLTGERDGSSEEVHVNIHCEPAVEITKSAGTSPVQPGGDVSFTMVVTNTGNVNLPGNGYSAATVEDSLSSALSWTINPAVDGCEIVDRAANGTGGTLECDLALDSGDSSAPITISAETADDNPECGEIPNTAYVSVYPDGSNEAVASDDDSASVTIDCVESWEVDKTSAITTDVAPEGLSLGDAITYTITITNTGNTDLEGLQLSDAFSGENDLNWVDFDYEAGMVDISYGESVDITATYEVVQEDVDAGELENCAHLSSNPDEEGCVIDPIETNPGVDAEKNLLTELVDPVAAGTVINYAIEVTNTGDTSQTEISVQENLVSGDPAHLDVQVAAATGSDGATDIVANLDGDNITITGNIPPGGVVTIPVQYTIQQADIDAGKIENCVVLEGDTKPSNNCASREDLDEPGVSLSKNATDGNYTVVLGEDDYISYTIVVTNTGNVTIDEATITDELLDLPTVPADAAWEVLLNDGGSLTPITLVEDQYALDTPLLPEESVTLVVRAALPDNVDLPETTDVQWCGPWPNAVDLAGTFGNDEVINEEDDATVQVNCTGLDIEKSSSTAGQALVPGDAVEYEIVVSNDGNMPVGKVSVIDSDLANAPLENIAATSSNGTCDVSTSGSVNCDLGFISAGNSVTVTITANVLPVGQIDWQQCEDGLSNTAKVHKGFTDMIPMGGITLPGVDHIVSEPAVVHDIACQPGISIEKTEFAQDPTVVEPLDRMDPGDTVTFEFDVENTGQVTLFNVELTDDHDVVWVDGDGNPVTDGNVIPELAQGETVTLYANYTLTQGNLDTGSILNCVDVIGYVSVNGGESVEDGDCEPVHYEQVPDIELEKTGSEIVVPTGELTYTLTLTNTGNVTALVATLTDSMPAGSSNWTVTSQSGFTLCGYLAEGELTCLGTLIPANGSASVTLTGTAPAQPSVEECHAGLINNAHVSTGTIAGGTEDEATWPTAYDCEPVLEIEKTVADASVSPEDTLEFTITVTNNGTYPATELSLLDDLGLAGVGDLEWTDDSDACEIVGGVLNCEIDEIPAYTGNEFTVTFSAEVQADNPVCGPYTNTVTLGGDDAQYATTPVSEVDFIIDCVPNYDVDKTSDADENGELSVGDTVTYTITVTNTGNQELSGIQLNDEFSGSGELTWTDPEGFDGVNVPDIAFGGNIDLVATYVITQADVDAGEIENCALMTYPVNGDAIERDDCTEDTLEQDPVYTVEKTSALTNDVDENDALSVGDTVTYTITVTNTGTVTLNDITLNDEFSGSGDLTWTAPEGFDGENVPEIEVGNSVDLLATYVITQTDVDAGEIENCALMTYPVNGEVIERDDCEEDDIPQNPDVDLLKTGTVSGGADVLALDNTITYTFTVTNSGNVTIENLEIDDPMEGVEFTDGNTIDTLAPGESVELEAEYSVAQLDVNVGMIVNCADVAGTAADGSEVTDNNCDTKVVDQERGLDAYVAHECPDPAEELLAEGTFEVTYELTVVNDGTVTVRDVVFTTSHEGVFDEPFPTTFEPGQSETRNWTITATEEEFESRVIDVEITVIGKTDNGATAMLASMAATQVLDDEVESRLVFTCPIDVPVDPESDPDSTPKPKPESPDKQAQAVDVSSLPVTGSGNVASTAAMLWAAAMLSVVALGATAVGIRVKHRR